MATHNSTTTMHGRIPAGAVSTTHIDPIDLVATAARRGAAPFDAAEQAAAMNAVLVALSAILRAA